VDIDRYQGGTNCKFLSCSKTGIVISDLCPSAEIAIPIESKTGMQNLARINPKIATKTQRHKVRFLFEYSFVSWWLGGKKYFARKCKEFILNALQRSQAGETISRGGIGNWLAMVSSS
jgi:hypothetical protein